MKRHILPAVIAGHLAAAAAVSACTGISLQTQDGQVVVGRTVEWALSDARHDRLVVFPRGWRFEALVPDDRGGMAWTGLHGFVSMTAYGQDYGPDGLNEAGLYVGMYYLPGFADYAVYDPDRADVSLSVGDFMQWLLSSFRTVAEVRANLSRVRVVNVQDDRFGGAPLPFHWKVADPGGDCIVLEFVDGGRLEVYDAFLGVITNAPTYDWHLTNLRNHLGLSPDPHRPLALGDLSLGPLGAGSGMLGLPGDFTPPSRFIRAAAFTATARPLATTADAVFEAFRILDSFNIPLGAIMPPAGLPADIEGATQITSVSDLANRVYYYHTVQNRRVRKIDLRGIDFAAVGKQVIVDGPGREREIRELGVR